MTALTGDYSNTHHCGRPWDMLAYRYYGDQYSRTVIVEANRHLFLMR